MDWVANGNKVVIDHQFGNVAVHSPICCIAK